MYGLSSMAKQSKKSATSKGRKDSGAGRKRTPAAAKPRGTSGLITHEVKEPPGQGVAAPRGTSGRITH